MSRALFHHEFKLQRLLKQYLEKNRQAESLGHLEQYDI